MISIIFDHPPGPESQFVEVERDGKSIEFGKWIQVGDLWHLELPEIDQLEKELALRKEFIEARKDRAKAYHSFWFYERGKGDKNEYNPRT